MIEAEKDAMVLILIILGSVVIASTILRKELGLLGVPAMSGFILLGVAISAADNWGGFITAEVEEEIDFLARVGVLVLLFHVGLRSNPRLLADQLGKAAVIWLPNMIIAGVLAFATVWMWPGYGLIPALFFGVAASATSVGVSTVLWEDKGQLGTDEGALLLDVAELDDASAVVLLSILFVVAPLLTGGAETTSIWSLAFSTALVLILKLIAFSALCFLFSRRIEQPLTAWFSRLDEKLGPLLFAVGAAFLIAGTAEALGLSLAIGALFAGLAFSRDPQELKIDRYFSVLLAIFGPFFFIAIGMAVDYAALSEVLGLAAVLFLVAVLGKVIGAGIPAALVTSRTNALLIGVSMVPRAEIFLIVMLYGLGLGPWAVPQSLYTAAVLVALASCVFAPFAMQRLFPSERGSAT